MVLLAVVTLLLGFMIGGYTLYAWGKHPQTVHELVHSNPAVCKRLGGVFEGDENGTMCILDSCTTPP